MSTIVPGATRLGPSLTGEASESLRFEKWLPTLLSVIAGMVDLISFLSLGIFTAHITGNIVVIGALVVRHGRVNLAQILSIPVFSVLTNPSANPHGLMAGIAAMMAVSAMACQFALLRLTLPVVPSTAVMTE